MIEIEDFTDIKYLIFPKILHQPKYLFHNPRLQDCIVLPLWLPELVNGGVDFVLNIFFKKCPI